MGLFFISTFRLLIPCKRPLILPSFKIDQTAFSPLSVSLSAERLSDLLFQLCLRRMFLSLQFVFESQQSRSQIRLIRKPVPCPPRRWVFFLLSFPGWFIFGIYNTSVRFCLVGVPRILGRVYLTASRKSVCPAIFACALSELFLCLLGDLIFRLPGFSSMPEEGFPGSSISD
ncbi:hypothetical protein NPIL_268031 [Nephila pilipes]|uniref:Uncharacterized protein n=1 Tax=Nephila pilipes TaxID=299642 RepID=A0A8X6QQS3_NEPPI|nr:hypothetical protein NPIL_268031 [Nephila pilipes]